MTTIPILLSSGLTQRLEELGIENYGPAYNGSSIGLDLYNIGETIRLPPGVKNYIQDWATGGEAETHIREAQFKQLYKNLIPTGLRIAVPEGWVAIIKERGSIIKTSLTVRAGVIDPGYTGEVFVNCVNLAAHPIEIEAGQKLPFQLVVVQANNNFVPVTEDQYRSLTLESTRKDGKIGSSDT